MKTTLDETSNGVVAAVAFTPEDLLSMTGVSGDDTVLAAPRRMAVDPSLAYGCVDWYIYPGAEPESAAA